MQGQQVQSADGEGDTVAPAGHYAADTEGQQSSLPQQQYAAGTEGQLYQQQDSAQQQQQATTSRTRQASIADILGAASDRVIERCGYEYNEGLDMYYDANSGLYYHQVSQKTMSKI